MTQPQFGAHAGIWIDERLFDKSTADELRMILKEDRHWSAERASAFLQAASEVASLFEAAAASSRPGETKRELAKLSRGAEAMQASLMALAGESAVFLEFENQWDILRLRAQSPFDLSEILAGEASSAVPDAALFCGRLWRELDALRNAAAFASENMKVPQEAKHTAMRAKAMAKMVAERYRDIYGCWPAKTKTTWFPAFMKQVGLVVGVHCTDSITEAAVTELQTRDRRTSEK